MDLRCIQVSSCCFPCFPHLARSSPLAVRPSSPNTNSPTPQHFPHRLPFVAANMMDGYLFLFLRLRWRIELQGLLT